jgi:hypothetical protein
MGITTELMDLDVQIFRLQARLVRTPAGEGTKKLETLLKSREKLLLKMDGEERGINGQK